MQQRQLRLGDILDDYCPRERRVTNHAIVAMVGEDVKQTRCTTCDAEHAYKHARMPRQRRKDEGQAALYSQVLAGGPKRVAHDPAPEAEVREPTSTSNRDEPAPEEAVTKAASNQDHPQEPGNEREAGRDDDEDANQNVEEGPAHRRLIRATLPRQEGQPPPTRPAPEFTIRQPNNRQGRFRPRHQQQQQRGASPFQGNRSGSMGGGGNRPPMMSRSGRHHGHKRSK